MRWIIPILMVSAACAAGTANARSPDDSVVPVDAGNVTVTARAFSPANPNIFGTVALDAGVTAYGARWRRVSAADEFDPRVRALGASVAASTHDPLAQLAMVHSEIDRRVQWRRDLDTYHVSDYWAQAGETLTRGEGDSEDIAVVKMQVLKAAGFPARDIYLSVGRDRARGADTMLLVRVGGQFYSLDDRNPRPVLASGGQQFVPVITLGKNSAWLHGRRIAGRRMQAASGRPSLAQGINR
jgi:predicted transglutaminase-like cysteine proteinase